MFADSDVCHRITVVDLKHTRGTMEFLSTSTEWDVVTVAQLERAMTTDWTVHIRHL